ncbi:MAG: hypothetical protein KF729_30220 [Sandaracinaceae bacterium]|nr:hypothetical protein [Sandaracinaceae bacterium]
MRGSIVVRGCLGLCLVWVGCGPRSLPERSSPALVPTGASAVLDLYGGNVLDARRDGLFARGGADGLAVFRGTATGAERLFEVPGGTGAAEALASRADDDVVIAFTDGLVRWDGAAATEITDRLVAALILGEPFDGLRVDALDVAEDGAIVLVASVFGQGGAAPYGQICRLDRADPSGDACSALPNEDAATAVVTQGARTYAIVGERLYRGEGVGALTPVNEDRVTGLRSLEGGRVAFMRDRNAWELVVLGPDGAEERRVASTWIDAGHSARGLWNLLVDHETDGSCSSFSWSCREDVLWTQLIVSHVTDRAQEVAHLDNPAGEPRLLPLADGSLRLEIGGDVYVIAAP